MLWALKMLMKIGELIGRYVSIFLASSMKLFEKQQMTSVCYFSSQYSQV